MREVIYDWRHSSRLVKGIFFSAVIISFIFAYFLFGYLIFLFLFLTVSLISILVGEKKRFTKFIMLDYQFFNPQVIIRLENQNFNNYQSNYLLWKFIEADNPDIAFEINEENDVGGAEAGLIDAQHFVCIDINMLKFQNSHEMKAMIFHEIGHIRLRHSEDIGILILTGYFVFAVFPFFLPFFWLVRKYVARRNELDANRFAAKKSSVYSVLFFLKSTKRLLRDETCQTNYWARFLFKTFSSMPSLDQQIFDIAKKYLI